MLINTTLGEASGNCSSSSRTRKLSSIELADKTKTPTPTPWAKHSAYTAFCAHFSPFSSLNPSCYQKKKAYIYHYLFCCLFPDQNQGAIVMGDNKQKQQHQSTAQHIKLNKESLLGTRIAFQHCVFFRCFTTFFQQFVPSYLESGESRKVVWSSCCF